MKPAVLAGALLLCVSSAVIAGPKKGPPPPVPKYWIGEFALADEEVAEPGKVQSGFVTVKAADAPAKAIVIQPLAPKEPATAVTGLGDADKIYSTKCLTPKFDDRLSDTPRVLVVDEAVSPKPALIKASKVHKAVRKKLAKDYPSMSAEAKKWSIGVADLDADGTGDVALLFGCHENDMGCVGHQTIVYERDGAGWKEIQLASDGE